MKLAPQSRRTAPSFPEERDVQSPVYKADSDKCLFLRFFAADLVGSVILCCKRPRKCFHTLHWDSPVWWRGKAGLTVLSLSSGPSHLKTMCKYTKHSKRNVHTFCTVSHKPGHTLACTYSNFLTQKLWFISFSFFFYQQDQYVKHLRIFIFWLLSYEDFHTWICSRLNIKKKNSFVVRSMNQIKYWIHIESMLFNPYQRGHTY